jgi:hypothetical protein
LATQLYPTMESLSSPAAILVPEIVPCPSDRVGNAHNAAGFSGVVNMGGGGLAAPHRSPMLTPERFSRTRVSGTSRGTGSGQGDSPSLHHLDKAGKRARIAIMEYESGMHKSKKSAYEKHEVSKGCFDRVLDLMTADSGIGGLDTMREIILERKNLSGTFSFVQQESHKRTLSFEQQESVVHLDDLPIPVEIPVQIPVEIPVESSLTQVSTNIGGCPKKNGRPKKVSAADSVYMNSADSVYMNSLIRCT